MHTSFARQVIRIHCLILISAAALQAGGPAEAYARRVTELVSWHRREIARLEGPAQRSGEALLKGATFWIAGKHPGWVSEATGRAGGTAAARPLSSLEAARKGDVVWMSYSPASYVEDLKTALELEKKGCVVTALGPEAPKDHSQFPHRLDSGTRWTDEEHLTLMGNVVSLWSLTAELAGYTSRHGKTMVLLQSVVVPGATERNAKYRGMMFHSGGPQMQPAVAGALAREYLGFLDNMLAAIREHEWSKLMRLSAEVRQCAKGGHPASLRMIGHLMPHVADSELFEIGGNEYRKTDALSSALRHSHMFVWLGYNEIPADLVSVARGAGAGASWVVASDATRPAATSKDVVIDQHWRIGDAAVTAPGYDIRILPPSAVAQLFVYDVLTR